MNRTHAPLRRLILLAGIALIWSCLSTPGRAQAGKRLALVIGNAAYESKPLPNCRNDAAAMAGALKRLGFADLQVLTDADLGAIRDAVDALGACPEKKPGACMDFRGGW